MNSLPISIIIPVSKDIKIKQCLDSVDEQVEIVVVLNNKPSREVIEIVNSDYRCRTFMVEETGCNLAAIFNKGIEIATNRKVLLTNSDCLFPPGLIFKINLLLENYDVVKARVKFAFKNNKQRLVAECRRLFHHVFDGGTKLFGPGLSFHKDIHNKIGGYFFDERIDWGEDGELSSRIYEANLNYYIVNDCLFHDEENILHDLSVAWRIGRGSRQKNKNKKDFFLEILEVNWHDPKNRIQIAYSEGGYSLAIYFFTWRVMTYLGYYFGKKRGV